MQLKDCKSNTLKVRINGKVIEIDLSKELSINEDIIMSQLRNSPSSYSFLMSVRDKYIKIRDSLEREKDIAYSEAYIYYKESADRMTNDMASHKANVNKKYISVYERYLEASNKANKLISACRAFESREKILTSINANLRKQQ